MRKQLLLMLAACGMLSTAAYADTKLEAEDAQYNNCVVTEDAKYSGGKALDCREGDSKITFTYTAEAAGKYNVFVGCDGAYGDKQVNLVVNGNTSSIQTTDGQTEVDGGVFMLNEGENTIEVVPSWTWYLIDYIRIDVAGEGIAFDIPATSTDGEAADCAKALYTFLYDNFGQKTISGIMTGDMTTANGDITQHEDVKAVYEASGKYPLLVGFDFMNATGTDEANDWFKAYTRSAIDLAKDTWKRGGIPAFTWHWRDPSRTTGEFYCENNGVKCDFKITDAMDASGNWDTSSDAYKNIVKDIDTVADYFLELQSEGMACIFRPLHEASGGWFWWGRAETGAAPYVKLYQLIRDEMQTVKGVHNVIWVWNPCNVSDEDWNPGENYFDVVGIDIYNGDNDHSSNYAAFDKLKNLTSGKKIIALTENGPIPDVEKTIEENAVWSWWMPWYQSWGGNFVNKTSNEEWAKCMGDGRVITLEDHAEGWGTTAIKSLKVAGEKCTGEIYDLQGRRLSGKPVKGLYIQNGEKYIVR